VPDDPTAAARADFRAALILARRTNRLDSAPLEAPARALARAYRESGISVAECLVTVKQMLREETGPDASIFIPSVVGWTVRGYYEGTSKKGG
jgi:hypothetical protein